MALLETPFVTNESPFSRIADRLIAGGYTCIPLVPREKVPGQWQGSIENGRWTLMDGWNDYSKNAPSPASITRWKTWPHANVGVVLGTKSGSYQLVCVDLDTDDYDELKKLQSQLPISRMTKKGNRGYTAFYRADMSVKTKRYMVPDPTPEKPTKKRTVLEILTGNAPRQTVMPPSIHPFGMTYEFLTGGEIVPISQLPVLTEAHFEQLEDTLESIGWNGAVEEPRRDRASSTERTADDDPTIWRETNNVALQQMHKWVGELGLPKLKRHPNGSWEAVPTWRPSNEGNPTMSRKANLKFHAQGIKDMGTDTGYTPLDVVGAAFSWDFDTCFRWLRGKLGLLNQNDFTNVVAPPRIVKKDENGTLYDQETGEVVGPDRSTQSTDVAAVAANDDEAPAEITVIRALPPIMRATRTADEELPDKLTRPPGVLGNLTDYIEKSAATPNRMIAFATALAACATLTGRRFSSPTLSGTALYVLVLGRTGCGKQHGLNSLAKILMEADAGATIGASEAMSQTALIAQIKNQPLSCSGVDEFGAYLKRINAKNAGVHDLGIKKVMLSAWGLNFQPFVTPVWANVKSETIHAPHFSMLAVATPESFYGALEGADIENGMLNRFLVLKTNIRAKVSAVRRTNLAMDQDLRDEICALWNRGMDSTSDQERLDYKHQVIPEALTWDEKTCRYYEDFANWCQDQSLPGSKDTSPFYARTAETGLRIATIQSLCRDIDQRVITLDDLNFGFDIARWSADSMTAQASSYMTDTAHQADSNRVISLLKKEGGSLEHKKLMRLLKNRFKVKDLKDIINSLTEAGAMTANSCLPEAGGSAEIIYTLQQAA